MERDKKLHFWACFLMTVVGAGLTLLMLAFTPLQALEAGLAGSLAAGVLKEVYDWVVNKVQQHRGLPPKHTVDPMDIWWSWLGSFVGGIFTATVML